MQSRPLQYTLRGIPSPRDARREPVVEPDLTVMSVIPAGSAPELESAETAAGWPDRLRSALALNRFFRNR